MGENKTAGGCAMPDTNPQRKASVLADPSSGTRKSAHSALNRANHVPTFFCFNVNPRGSAVPHWLATLYTTFFRRRPFINGSGTIMATKQQEKQTTESEKQERQQMSALIGKAVMQ